MLRSRRLGPVVLLALVTSLLGPGSTPAHASPHTAAPAPRAAACHHLAAATGVTARTITIGNASDVSGPVAGLFLPAEQGVQAFAAYFNATHQTICGRGLAFTEYDSKTDAGADQQAYVAACAHTFAMVGSESAFDSGGASTAQSCGLPDLRTATNTAERRACTTCFSVHPDTPTQVPNALASLLIHTYGGGDNAAMLWLTSASANATRAQAQVSAESKRGVRFSYLQAVDTTEFNYAPYVQAMKDKHVETVQFVTGHNEPALEKLAMTMKELSFHPKVLLVDTTAYDASYGDYGVNTVVYLDSQPFEAPHPSRELTLYRHWLTKAVPHAAPTVDGLYAWSAARLFAETAQSLGSELTRASLVAALRKVRKWRDHDLHAPQAVGSGNTGGCLRFIRHSGDTWVPVTGRRLHCDGLTTVRLS